MDDSNRRLVLRNFLSIDECKELEFIHKSSSTVGYRSSVFSTTLSHLIATASPHLIIPFVPIRERLKEKTEEFFGCPYELCIEFTGLISWCRGASIGWHSDDNRSYLTQRHFTAVCYLNSHGKDFKGGILRFQDGNPSAVVPMAGDVVLYTADSRNTHSVDERSAGSFSRECEIAAPFIIGMDVNEEITEGERLTLTLWFSRDSAHDEDSKLISLLSASMLSCSDNVTTAKFPKVASSNMYWFSPDTVCQNSGFDICCERMHVLGFDIYSSQENSRVSDLTELLTEPLQLARGNKLFEQIFGNVLHALQAVHFLSWKTSELENCQFEVDSSEVLQLSDSQLEKISSLRSRFLKDHRLADKVFSCMIPDKNHRNHFDWAKFRCAIRSFEVYTCKLHKQLQLSLPYWRTEAMIYTVPFEGS